MESNTNHPGNTERARQVKVAVSGYYHIPGNEAGGNLHIVLDDKNIESHHIEWCRNEASKNGDHIGVWLADQLLSLNWEELCYVVDIGDPAGFKEEIEAV